MGKLHLVLVRRALVIVTQDGIQLTQDGIQLWEANVRKEFNYRDVEPSGQIVHKLNYDKKA